MIMAFLLHVFIHYLHCPSIPPLPGTHQLYAVLCKCACVYICVYERKPGASSYTPLNQNTVEFTLINGAFLFRIKREFTGCKASFLFATLLLHTEQAALDLGLCPQLGQTRLNRAVTTYATGDTALGMQLREHLSQPPPRACTSSPWQPHFTADGRLCPTGGQGTQKKLLPVLLS